MGRALPVQRSRYRTVAPAPARTRAHLATAQCPRRHGHAACACAWRWSTRYTRYGVRRRIVGAEHAFSGIRWTALTLEVGKSPTEVSPGKGGCRWHLGRRFASSLRRRAQKLISPNRAVLSTTLGRQHGELQNQRSARATRSLGACATRPDHAVDMLAEERLCKRHPGWRSIHAAPRLCAPELSYLISYPTAGSSARASQSTQILRAACAQPPHSRRVVAEHV